MTRKGILAIALAATLLFIDASGTQAHSAPSRCNITVTNTGNGNTLTEVWVGHINDGDKLTANYTDMGRGKTKAVYRGTTYLGTNVSKVSVTDRNRKKVC